MNRVMVIGCGGAGKSTLARKLGEKTGRPVVHLDQIWWAPGNWQHLEKPEFDERLLAELEKPRWIVDGNFNRTIELRLERCDTVIYLDYPRLVCLKNWQWSFKSPGGSWTAISTAPSRPGWMPAIP